MGCRSGDPEPALPVQSSCYSSYANGSVTWGSAVSERLERLRDALLVQCTAAQAHDALTLADHRPAAGVVVCTRKRADAWALADAAERAGTVLLVDAERYKGKSRLAGSQRFDPGWLRMQREADLPVLSDSGHIAEHDVAGLDSVLGQARAHGDVIAVLPLASSWWFDRARGLPCLLDKVHDAGVPIAVVLEHRADPLSVARSLDGLLALLGVGVPVVQLRCDVSGLGLICHGAHAAAVGTSTSLRHLFPAATGGGGGGRPASISTLVGGCLSYIAIEKIALAVAADPDDSLWTACLCPACKGRQLDTIAQAPEHERAGRAFGHALHTLFDLRDHLIGRAANQVARQQSWHEHCSSALARYDQLDAAGQGWTVPAFLRNWYRVPVPSHAPQ